MKKNKLINQKDIKTVLKHAHDLPSLENKFYDLANIVLDLEIKKKELKNTIMQQNTQLFDLGQIIRVAGSLRPHCSIMHYIFSYC
jgi:hypothetical protein